MVFPSPKLLSCLLMTILPASMTRTIHIMSSDLLFGVSSSGSFLVVAYTERSETIRIISARRMTSLERKAYER